MFNPNEIKSMLKMFQPEISKTVNKHGVEYDITFSNGSSYEFSMSKASPGKEFLESVIDMFVVETNEDPLPRT